METVIVSTKEEKTVFKNIKDREFFYSGGVLYMRICSQDLKEFIIDNVNAISIINAGLTCFDDDETVFKASKIIN